MKKTKSEKSLEKKKIIKMAKIYLKEHPDKNYRKCKKEAKEAYDAMKKS